jgi:hypothetical protein
MLKAEDNLLTRYICNQELPASFWQPAYFAANLKGVIQPISE